MMNFLKKFRDRLVHILFPFLEHFYPFLSLILIVAAWSIPETYWQIRTVSFWLWFATSEVHWAGTMELDYLPIQPGSSLFYHIYRFIDRAFFLFLLTWLVIALIPGPLWLKNVFAGLLIAAVALRAVGDKKYRPKKPEE